MAGIGEELTKLLNELKQRQEEERKIWSQRLAELRKQNQHLQQQLQVREEMVGKLRRDLAEKEKQWREKQ